MKEYKKLSIALIGLMVCGLIFYSSINTNKPKKIEKKDIYNTEKLNKEDKEQFKNSIEDGDAHAYLGNEEKAIEQYEQAEQLNPNDVQTLYRLASSQHNAGHFEEAENTLKKLEFTKRNSPDYWSFRATNIA